MKSSPVVVRRSPKSKPKAVVRPQVSSSQKIWTLPPSAKPLNIKPADLARDVP